MSQATLDSDEKAAEARDIVIANGGSGAQGVWFGLTDEATEGTFVWTKTGEEATNFDWGSGQPDSDTRGNCVILYASGDWRWYDTWCDETFAFNALCEVEATGEPQPEVFY